MIQSHAKGVPKRRNMWSHDSHQPPISSNIGLRGCGQCRSSKTQKSFFSVSEAHSIGNSSSPRNWPRMVSSSATSRPPLSRPVLARCSPRARPVLDQPSIIDYAGRAMVATPERAAGAPSTAIASALLRMTQRTPTQYWNDSCAVAELEHAVARGATGATSNPSIVLEVLKKESGHWMPRVRELALANPSWTEVELTWAIVEEMAARGAAVLEPVFASAGGLRGRLSVQTN